MTHFLDSAGQELRDEVDFERALGKLQVEADALEAKLPTQNRPERPKMFEGDVILNFQQLGGYVADLRVLAPTVCHGAGRLGPAVAHTHAAAGASPKLSVDDECRARRAAKNAAAASLPREEVDASGMTATAQCQAVRAGKRLVFPPAPKTITDLCREAKANTQPHH